MTLRSASFTHRHASARVMSGPAVAFATLVGALNALLWHGHQYPDDWASLWIGGMLVRDGRTDWLYDVWEGDFARWTERVWDAYVVGNPDFTFPHPYLYIPVVAWAVAGLQSFMSYQFSVLALTFAQGFCLVVLVASAWRLWFRRVAPLPQLAGATVAVWLTAAFQFSSHIGQTTPLILAGVAYGMAAAYRRPLVAGVILGIVGAIKLTPLVLVVVLAISARTRLTALVTALTAVAMAGVSWLLAGSAVMRTWIDTLRWLSGAGIVEPVNQAFTSVFLEPGIVRNKDQLVPIVTDMDPWMSLVPQLVAVVLGLGVVAAAWRNPLRAPEILGVGLFCVATLTADILWTHYLIVAVLPTVGILALCWRRHRTVVWSVLAAAWVALYPPVAQYTGVAPGDFFVVWGGLASLSTICVLFVVVAFIGPEPRRRARV